MRLWVVVGLCGGGDGLAGVELAGDPEGFEVGEGSSAGEVAEVLGEAEHPGECGLRLPAPWRSWRGRRRARGYWG